jgi:hypothetical protein
MLAGGFPHVIVNTWLIQKRRAGGFGDMSLMFPIGNIK